jgi:hypothetical protein
MKTLIGVILAIAIFVSAALAINDQYQTRLITSSTLTIHVKDTEYLTIRNFTQDNAASGQRGLVVVTLNPASTTPTPTAVPTATPISLTTTAGPGVSLSSFDSLTDTATLSGGTSPTGSITFTLTDPNSSVVDIENVTVNGDGNYDTPNGYSPGFNSNTSGTYTWSASYSGDINNASVHDNGQNETAVVTDTPTPAPTATPTPTPTPTTTPAATPVTGSVLTATVLNPIGILPNQAIPSGESVKPFLIAGPALLTIDPVPGATLSITYRKSLQRIQATPTATASSAISTTGSGSTFTSSKASSVSGASSSHSTTTVTASTVTDDDEDSSSPSPSPTPTPASTSTPRPTPTPSAIPTPTPSPSAIPTPTSSPK